MLQIIMNMTDQYQVWKDKTDNADYMKKLVEDGENVKIVGIVQSAEDAKASSLTPGINYTSDLVNHVAEQAKGSEIVKQQLANPNVNVFTGEEFGNTDGNNGFDMNSLFSIDEDALKNAFGFDSSAMNNLGSSMDLSGLDLSKAFQMDGNSMDLSGMVNLDQVEINMDNMPQMNLGDILTNLDVQVNADGMQKMLVKPFGRVSGICKEPSGSRLFQSWKSDCRISDFRSGKGHYSEIFERHSEK